MPLPGETGEPRSDCDDCPRLVRFRIENERDNPDWHNAPVPSFGPESARLLIVGLAPGLKGANRTGRPFTGDYAGELLYPTLAKFGLSQGDYAAHRDDGLALRDCMITNAVRCVPPKNKPIGSEITACRRYLAARIGQMPRLRAVLALGRIAHDTTISALELRRAAYPFGHGNQHSVREGLWLFDSYHCSRYNINTGRLTEEMFHSVFKQISHVLASH